MLKKVNMVIVMMASVLTVLLDVGFLFYIPIVFFYLLKDYRNIYYIIPSTIISLLLFTGTSYLIPFGILSILLLLVLWIMRKLTQGYYMYIIVGLLGLITYIITYKGFVDPALFILMFIVSIMLYMYFEKNLFEALKLNSSLYNNTVSELLIIVVSILGASKINIGNINLGFVLAVFFAMFAAISWKNIYALIYALISVLILTLIFNIEEGLFIPFIVSFYFLSFVYPVIIVNVFSLVVILLNTNYYDELMLTIMGVSLLFEIFKKFIVTIEPPKEEIKEGLYSQIVENLSNEVLNFAAVLDRFATSFKTPKEYNNKMHEALNILIQRHCNNCPRKKECYKKNKKVIYPYFKNLILQKDLYTKELRDFLGECYHSKGLNATAKNLNYRIDLGEATTNNMLITQVTGVASAIRQYAVDMISKEEISYEVILNFREKLKNYGFNITYFEVVKSFCDDFSLKIGIKNIYEEAISSEIKSIADLYLGKSSVIFENIIDNTSYFQIIPEIKLDIIYGTGAISSEGNQICGDNFLVKNLKNGKFISAISDGMGSGYSAFEESSTTLNLINDIIELNLNSSTSLEVLNTFYSIQEYLEKYSTLDLVEINRYTKEAKFYKMGGATSYIVKKDGKIEKVVNQNLPFGVGDNIENYNYVLENGDLILMSSDGIFENIIEEKSLEDFIVKIKEEAPQKIVYEILNFTMKQKLKTTDDMTLIALKIKYA